MCIQVVGQAVNGTRCAVSVRPVPPVDELATREAGRRYTVRYQNLLPSVTLNWPDAPPAERYQAFIVPPRGKRRELPGQGSTRRLPAGKLREGEHRFWFQAVGGKRSKQGTVKIVFDNTSRTAYLSRPAVGEGVEAGAVRVAGAALSRSEVSVGELRIPLDRQGRFNAEVPVASERVALAVRVAHPATGVHYYLRRLTK